ncbi:MAG: hypothetical protein WC695_10710 [Candidatus Omnitrophota bacterium]
MAFIKKLLVLAAFGFAAFFVWKMLSGTFVSDSKDTVRSYYSNPSVDIKKLKQGN